VLVVESRVLDDAAKRQLGLELNGALLAKVGIRADRIVPVEPGRIGAATNRDAVRAEMRRAYGDGQLA
jgi:hypothetical protein